MKHRTLLSALRRNLVGVPSQAAEAVPSDFVRPLPVSEPCPDATAEAEWVSEFQDSMTRALDAIGWTAPSHLGPKGR